jgi:hypothetical protein
MWRRSGLAILLALLLADLPLIPSTRAAAPGTGRYAEPNAVLVNVTESDLNRVLSGTLLAGGGSFFEGSLTSLSKGFSDVHYRASVSDPVLKLSPDGEAVVSVSIREARLTIGRYERRTGRKVAYCENLGATVEPGRPVDVALSLRFAIEGENLRVVPTGVSIPDAEKNIQLIKPSRCKNGPLPTWLLWWIGKPRLRRRLGSLEDVLLASVKESASRLDGGLFLKRWDLGASPERGEGEGLLLRPDHLDTSRGALFMSLAASDAPGAPVNAAIPEWAAPLADRTYVSVSESFLNAISRQALSRISLLPREPGTNMQKLIESDAFLALVPGARGIEEREKLYLTFRLGAAPEVALRSVPLSDTALATGDEGDEAGARAGSDRSADGREGEGATMSVHLSGLEMQLWEAAAAGNVLLGTVTIDSGDVTLSPRANPLGGISFEVLSNDWVVSSNGIEFNEELIAAAIQEMIFAEAFESRYAPLLRAGLGVGDARLMPRSVRVVERHLIVEFAGSGSGYGDR